MIDTVVVPLDRSLVAERAVPFAEAVARQIGARLIFLSVVELPVDFAEWVETVAQVKMEAEREYTEYLKEVASRVEGVEVDVAVRFGSAATEILKFVESLPRALLVMASHGRTGFRRLVLGSVTQQVVHRITTPVIVVPARAPDPARPQPGAVRRILVPLDGSKYAERALDTGLAIFGPTRPELILLRVVEVVTWLAGLEPYIKSARKEAASYLEEQGMALAERGLSVSLEVRVGSVPDEINAVALQYDVDMIVMATHGRSGATRRIFGSVAEKQLRLSPVPLMLVRSGQECDEVERKTLPHPGLDRLARALFMEENPRDPAVAAPKGWRDDIEKAPSHPFA